MTDKEFVLQTMKEAGLARAQTLQAQAPDMTGTELCAAEDFIPDFQAACALKNMLERTAGFVCRSSAGRVVKLLQPYDSSIYTQEPEELPAQWGFQWSTDPAKATPYAEPQGTRGMYQTDECCTENGHVWKCTQANTVYPPSQLPGSWTDLGTVEEVQG